MSASNRSTDNAAVAGEAELEYMRKEDRSWHPCHVSLCVTGVGLIVKNANAESGDIVLNGEETLKGLRRRSIPINGDECVHIQEGDRILATEKLEIDCLFYDAVVEKALKVRHSKRSPCRCTFRIKWLNRDTKENTMTVTADLIMKLDNQSIIEHPVIRSFLEKLKNSECYSSPMPNIENYVDHEMDLHELLEKQIAVISNSVDVSKEIFVRDFQLGVKFNNKGEIQCRLDAKSKLTKPIDSTTPQRTTRSQKLQMSDKRNPTPPTTSSPHDSFNLPNNSLLNPLAARAALASLMSKIPHEGKFSVNINLMQSLNCPDICDQSTTPTSDEPQSFTSSKMSTLKRDYGYKISEVPNNTPKLNSAIKRKLSSASAAKTSKIARNSIANDSTGRVTRSSVSKVYQNTDAKQGMEECTYEKMINSHSTSQNDSVKGDIVVEKSYRGINNIGEKESSAGFGNSTSTGRLTRSQVLEGQKSQIVEDASLSYKSHSSTSPETSTLKIDYEKGNKSSEVPSSSPNLNSAMKKKFSAISPSKASKIALNPIAIDNIRRVTRSSVCEVNQGSPSKTSKIALNPIAKDSIRRITRSSVCEVNQCQNTDAKQGIDECIANKLIQSHSTNRNDTVKRDSVVEKSYRGNNSLGGKKGKELEDNPARTGRLTRSKILEGGKSQNLEATYVLEEDKFFESAWPNSIEGKDGASNAVKVAGNIESKEITKKNSISKKDELRRSPPTRSQMT